MKSENNLRGKSCQNVLGNVIQNLLLNNCYRLQKSNDMLVFQ